MESNLSNLLPYLILETEQGFYFDNEQGVTYYVYFTDATGYFPDSDYGDYLKIFGFEPTSESNGTGFDQRTSETLLYLLVKFFEQDSRNVALYVCDQTDGRQAHRKRLFERWFRQYATKSFVKFDEEFEDIVYISAITSSQNPLLERFESDFRFLRSYLK